MYYCSIREIQTLCSDYLPIKAKIVINDNPSVKVINISKAGKDWGTNNDMYINNAYNGKHIAALVLNI